MTSKKVCTAIYVVEYGDYLPRYAGFANYSKSELGKKLRKLNWSLTKNYWLEEEVIMRGLFPREMNVLKRKNAIYRIEEGKDIEKYIGHACNYIDDEVRDKIKKLSAMSLVKSLWFYT